ncbi:MAG: ATP-dependent zinc metalloprotease FtsH [Anaerolineaceae bacterium]|nr:ATP-dependent zinc metalloprotease FtsH [Anaerolineaceae bacterium]
MNSKNQSYLLYAIIIIVIIALALGSYARNGEDKVISINQLATDIQAGDVSKITIANEDELTIIYKEGGTERTSRKETETSLIEQLTQFGVSSDKLSGNAIDIRVKPQSVWIGIFNAFLMILPFAFMGVLFFIFFRQAQGNNNAAMSFGKSRAKMFSGDQPTVTFDDVAGVEESKDELMEIVEFLREPEKFIALGARIPKGVLLVGPPGTGKTLLAKAVSGEAGVPFFSISGSEFVEMFVGVGASRVRDLFDQAKRQSPCIVFVDEIDAVGRQRGAGLGGSHDEREQTLNQMLVEMDGFDTDTNIIIIAATNRPDILDPALLRPGRFDRRVVLDRPDVKGREAILKVHVKGKPISAAVDLAILARGTPGFVGADIENLVNEAAILAARHNKKTIEQSDFQESIERVIAGPERKSRLISEEEKRIVAYHEAGHAIVLNAIPHANPVHKVSIIARGMAAGYTLSLPDYDRTMMSRKKLLAEIVGLLGGRVAEEMVFDDITAGASNDIERVTMIAREMVTRLGMSDIMGPMVYGKKEELVFLGREISEQRDYSEEIANRIDQEVKRIVNEAYEQTKEILTKYRDKLEAVAQKLLEVETINREEFEAIFPPPIPKSSGTPQLLADA